jgi:hypothetical protein
VCHHVAECAGCGYDDDEAAALKDQTKRRTAAGTSKKCPPVFNTLFEYSFPVCAAARRGGAGRCRLAAATSTCIP